VTDGVRAREGQSRHERCPYCHEAFADSPDEERVTCAGCGTPHHAECFAEHGGCSTLGCERDAARVAGGAEVSLASLEAPAEARRSSLWPVTAFFLVLSPLFFVGSMYYPSAIPLFLLALAAVGFLVVGRSLGAAIEEDVLRSPDAAPFLAPPQAPLHGADGARILNATARLVAPLPEPTGPTTACPSCSRTLEGSADLAFCYHCGAVLAEPGETPLREEETPPGVVARPEPVVVATPRPPEPAPVVTAIPGPADPAPVVRAVPRSTPALVERLPGSSTCPSCSKLLEDVAGLSFCYHCGASLA
jgi:hypothetical protein